MRYYVVSDVHGFYTPLMKALTEAGYFADSTPHRLVVCGDLLDRGKEAVKMQDFVLGLMECNETILIRGNHEDLFEELVTIDKGLPFSHHLQNGTYGTALQLTGLASGEAMVQNFAFADAARKTPYYRTIIPATRDYYETERYIFVHGWIPSVRERNGGCSYIANWREASEQEWRRAQWYNGILAARTATDENKTIVCGHWHTSYGHSRFEKKGPEFGEDADFSPYYAPGMIALDACTTRSGFVNCIVLEDDEEEQHERQETCRLH